MTALFKSPKVTPQKTMPTPDDKAIQEARRRRMATAQKRSGALSTILSKAGSRETLG